MRSYVLLALCFIVTTILAGCQLLVDTQQPIKNDDNAVTIHAVEYYSRAPVTTVEVALTVHGTTEHIGRELVDAQGTATFKHLQAGTVYTVSIYRKLHGVSEVQSTHSFLFDPQQQHVFFETYFSNAPDGLAVPLVMQQPALPNGCEITSLAAILHYYGEHVDHTYLAEHFLKQAPITVENGVRYGPDPNIAFAGDPASLSGYYVFAPPIAQAANDYFASVERNLQAYDITGAATSELQSYVAKGIPVLAWLTIDLEPARTVNEWILADGTKHAAYSNLHAVVIMDITAEYVTVMNPLTGYETMTRAQFDIAYTTLQNRAVVVY